jgi:hypothetical protein
VVGDFFPGFRKKVTHAIAIRTPVRTCSSVQTPNGP